MAFVYLWCVGIVAAMLARHFNQKVKQQEKSSKTVPVKQEKAPSKKDMPAPALKDDVLKEISLKQKSAPAPAVKDADFEKNTAEEDAEVPSGILENSWAMYDTPAYLRRR